MTKQEKLNSFIKYCEEHPEERFWQSLRNWSGFKFILEADQLEINTRDTFYLEDK